MSSKLKKGGAFEYAKMFQSSLSPCDKKEMLKNNLQNGGSSCAPNDDSYNTNYSKYYQNNPDTSIRLYNDYSQDWHYPNTLKKHIPYAINSSAGINEYQFGRTTPNNKFIVATGLVKNNVGIEMTGGKKKKKSKTTSSSIGTMFKKVKSSSKKLVKKAKPFSEKAVKKVKSSSKKLVKKVKSSTTKKPKSTKKSKSVLNKTKNALKSVGKKVSNFFSKK
jgi:hypothetical protein